MSAISDSISIGLGSAGLFSGIFVPWLVRKNARISLLEAKIEAKDDIINELKLQNIKLEVTGTIVNKVFSQLPVASQPKEPA
jgi:hypothetical protein